MKLKTECEETAVIAIRRGGEKIVQSSKLTLI